jgi:hypothetical protein
MSALIDKRDALETMLPVAEVFPKAAKDPHGGVKEGLGVAVAVGVLVRIVPVEVAVEVAVRVEVNVGVCALPEEGRKNKQLRRNGTAFKNRFISPRR